LPDKMANKPEANARSRSTAQLAGRLKSVYGGLSDRALFDACIGVFIVLVISLLLLHYRKTEVTLLTVGTVAPEDVIAPENLRVEDTDRTIREQHQAVAAVQPVYDFNPRLVKDASSLINQVFESGRGSAPDVSPEALKSNLEAATGLALDPELVGVLATHHFDPDLEKLLVDHLEATLTNGVVNRRGQLVKLAVAGFIRRDTRSGEELTVTDLSSVRDLVTARASLRSDKLVWPPEYSAREKTLLVELLDSLLIPTLTFNEAETEARRTAAQRAIPPVTVSIQKGQPIILHGETVTPVRESLLEQAAKRHRLGQGAVEFAGTLIIVLLLLLVLWQYMVRYQQRHLRIRRHFLLQITAFIITLGFVRVMFSLASAISGWATYQTFSSALSYEYLVPLAVGTLLVTLLTDAQAAFVFSAILAVFVGVLSNNVYLAAYCLLSSVGAIYHLKGCRDRASLMRAGMWIGLVNAAAAFALDLLGAEELKLSLIVFDAFCGFLGGILASMVVSVLLPLFEWTFEITTDIKLLELSNLNLPLLRQLAERAPGTYHHSIMVGLLAESAAEAIGGDALFARVACYYHDIGKMVRPTYFVENQTYLENRHDRLTPRMSSLVLANHVKQGIELARSYKLPPRIISIIPQHHGTGLMKYFYYKARESADDPDSPSLEHEFRYPGPKPQTKEAAVIMIADSVEAASRTVKAPTPAKLRAMIDTIIARIRDDHQFDECNITIGDLNTVADSFVKVLTGIHHHRIAYPGYDFERAGQHTAGFEPALAAAAAPVAAGDTLSSPHAEDVSDS
jgi:putative nucleotidyltransferase with HDIG domain